MNLRRLLRYAIDHVDPERFDIYPVTPNVCEMRRSNDKHRASITVQVPDETVVNLRGEVAERDLMIFVRIPREIARTLESGLVLPGVDMMPHAGRLGQ